jgi:hypothetical protein
MVTSLRSSLRAVTWFGWMAGAFLACASDTDGPTGEAPVGEIAQAVVTVGDWNGYGDGQCVIGAQAFYKNRFGVTLKATGYQPGNVGPCKNLGACMYWVSDIVRPDPNLWNRYDFGSKMPQTYDLVIYPPTSSNAYGHIASVDHMEGGDPNNHTQLYVMDSNALVYEKKSPYIHTNKTRPYGFYRLKSLEVKTCNEGCDGNAIVRTSCERTECGAQAACIGEGGLRCDALPTGYLDAADATTIRGWGYDPSNAGATADVHLYLGGPAGDPNALSFAVHADRSRDDLCSAIGSCAHAFAWKTPRSLFDGAPHEVHAYGIDLSGGHNAELQTSPRILTVSPPDIPSSTVLRRVPSPAAFASWQFSEFFDVAPMPSDAAKFSAGKAMDTPSFPTSPEAVRADDGTDQVWLLDNGLRRKIDAVAWRVGNVKTVVTPVLMQIPQGKDLPATPELVRDSGPTFYVLDAPLTIANGETEPTDAAPTPSGASTAAPQATTAKPSGGAPTNGASPHDGTTIDTDGAASTDNDAAACSVGSLSPASAPRAPLAAVVGLGLVALVARRRRDRQAS